jgi:hypothetical protein
MTQGILLFIRRDDSYWSVVIVNSNTGKMKRLLEQSAIYCNRNANSEVGETQYSENAIWTTRS